LIDAGGELQGYTADITRTFPVNGRYSGPQKEMYEVVLAAQMAAIAELVPGHSSARPHQVATRVLTEGLIALGLLHGEPDALIESGAQRRFYMHGTGHWLGLDVHDVGRYRLDDEPRPFAPGMVMTVEPGLYIAPGSEGVDPRFWGIGIRIEDDVLVTAAGPEVLTGGVPKEIVDVEALMRAA
jgi:Xaa-Pro aminopeptidase